MPELPDLAHIETKLRSAIVGRRILAARTSDPLVLRMMIDEALGAALEARHLEAIDRRGHFIRFQLEGERVVVVNAMLVGRYRLVPTGEKKEEGAREPRSTGLALDFDGGVGLQYLDDKRMGKVYVARAADEKTIPVYGELGVDVLSPAFTRELFGKLLRKRRDQARMFLMDKAALASIGNAYADEILFAARIHPKTFCNKLAPEEAEALFQAIPSVLRNAIDEIARRDEPIARGRASSARATPSRGAGDPSRVPEWESVKVRDFLAVRGRDGKPCPRCGTTIRAVRVGAGDACFCPKCQPAARKLFVDWGNLPPR